MKPEFVNGQIVWMPDHPLLVRPGQRLKLASIEYIQKLDRFKEKGVDFVKQMGQKLQSEKHV